MRLPTEFFKACESSMQQVTPVCELSLAAKKEWARGESCCAICDVLTQTRDFRIVVGRRAIRSVMVEA